ncbi:MAG: hypothetical protein V3R78_05045 [Thermodesulfobacteriota bacterium]
MAGELDSATKVSVPRVGVYQRYYGGNADEGWTNLLLEQFGFPYSTLMDDIIKGGELNESYDIIIIPNDPEAMITGEGLEEYMMSRSQPLPNFPPEYKSGLGSEGVKALKEYVKNGGRLVCLNQSCEFAIHAFDLKVRNVLNDLNRKEFFCPGSTIHVKIDPLRPIGYGMPLEGLVFFWDGLAFEILPSEYNDK